MPLTTVECCQGCEVTPQECVDHAATGDNTCPYTAELLAAMFDTVQDRGERITTTAVISKCLRQEHLSRNYPYSVEPKSLWKSFRGTMFHGRLEQYAGPGTVAEARYYAELPELGELTGSPDLVDVKRGILSDYKNTGSPPRFGTPWKDHVQQVNINRWLVDHAHSVAMSAPVEGLTHREDTDPIHGTTTYIFDLTDSEVRAHFVPVDWQGLVLVYMNDDGPLIAPCLKSIDVPKKNGDGFKKARVADIWDDEYAEAFIRERYETARAALVERELPPIPPGYEGQSHVLCGYCPMRAKCRELELAELFAPAA